MNTFHEFTFAVTFAVSIMWFPVFLVVLFAVSYALDLSLIGLAADYALDTAVKIPNRWQNPPSNNGKSIRYLLYTPKSWKKPCLLEPSSEQFDKCSFQRSYETKFLIHGFVVRLTIDNSFNVLKDALLEHGDYNVIIVDWTLYNSIPFEYAYEYAKAVGEKVAEMMEFIKNYKKVSLKTFHCIGHSLGSDICGVAGRNIQTLGRITGLDSEAASVYKSLTPDIRLNYTDAEFVDVMHTSDIFSGSGLGYLDSIGHLDFYPNSGVEQPKCAEGNKYKVFAGETITVQTILDKILCNHHASIEYFTQSLKDGCKFVATECQSYSDFQDGLCSTGVKAEMGFYSKKIEGIPPMTKFYLTTLDSPPYCKDRNNSIRRTKRESL